MSWGEMYEGEAAVEVWKPGKHLRARFPAVGSRSLATDYYLKGRGGRTVLRVVTSGFGTGEAWDGEYDGVRFGWAFELQGLRHYLERHHGEDRIVARVQRTLPPSGEPTTPGSSITTLRPRSSSGPSESSTMRSSASRSRATGLVTCGSGWPRTGSDRIVSESWRRLGRAVSIASSRREPTGRWRVGLSVPRGARHSRLAPVPVIHSTLASLHVRL